MEFFTERTVKAAKPHRCSACETPIEIGEAHSYQSMKYCGDFTTNRQHLDCRAAECALANLHGLYGGEDWIFLNDLDERDDLVWLREHHPTAFARVAPLYDHWFEATPPSGDAREGVL